MKQPTLLQIGQSRDGGRYFCAPARARGWRIILIDGPQGTVAYAKGKSSGEPDYDEVRFLPSSCTDEIRQEVMRIAERESVRLVIPGFELFTVIAREAHDWIALQGFNTLEVVERFRFKSRQREWLRDHGQAVLQPQFIVCRNEADFSAALPQITFPAVLKVHDSGGSAGVYRIESIQDARLKYDKLVGFTRDDGLVSDGILLIEELIDGPEVSVQGIVDCVGQVFILGMSKKTIVGGKSGDQFMEKQHLLCPPSTVDPRVRITVQDAILALGLRATPFHMDLRLSPEGPVFIESGARLSGAGVPRLLQAATGWDWADLALAVWSGEVVSLSRCLSRFAGACFITPPEEGAVAGYRMKLPAAGLAAGETATLTVFNVGGPGGYQHISDRIGQVEVVAGSEDRVRDLLEVVAAALRPLTT